MSTSHYRKFPLYCMGHPLSKRPCVFEPKDKILHAARIALQVGTLDKADFCCIERDLGGFLDIKSPWKRNKNSCKEAYLKIGRRLCDVCARLWSKKQTPDLRIIQRRNRS